MYTLVLSVSFLISITVIKDTNGYFLYRFPHILTMRHSY